MNDVPQEPRKRAAPIVGTGAFTPTTNGAEWIVRVPKDDPVFAGHFPEVPIFPGVYTLDLVYQAAALFFQRSGHNIRLVGVHSVRYMRPLGPDDLIRIVIEVGDTAAIPVAVRAVVHRGEDKAATAKILVEIAP